MTAGEATTTRAAGGGGAAGPGGAVPAAATPVHLDSYYAEFHKADWVGQYYDEYMYRPGSHDSVMWDIQRPYVQEVARGLAGGRVPGAGLKHLDFACGTGRLTEALRPLVAESTGVDASASMLAYARRKVPGAVFKEGDILAEPALVDRDYDLITAFRFFLCTEPAMREAVMASLAARLRGPESRLVFNIHGNTWSVIQAPRVWRAIKRAHVQQVMSYRDVQRLVRSAGLEIESWRGFALCPNELYATPLAPALTAVDRWVPRQPALKWVCQDLLFVCRPR
jgi:SAM-dependent methyltransferase